jgi:hypothetical protein
MTVAARSTPRPVLTDTIDAYLAQISLSLRPSSVTSAAGVLRRFAGFVAEFDPAVVGTADIERRHIEGYKL